MWVIEDITARPRPQGLKNPTLFSKLSKAMGVKKTKNFKTKTYINNQESKWFLLLVKYDFRRRETPYFKTQRPGFKKNVHNCDNLEAKVSKKMAANSLTLYKTHIQLRSFRWLPNTSIPSTITIRFQWYCSRQHHTSAGGGTAPNGVLPSRDTPQTTGEVDPSPAILAR